MTEAELVQRLRVLADAAEEAGLSHLTRVLRDDSAFNGEPLLRRQLEPEQLVHWPTMRWLFAESARRGGRTTLLMLAAIAEADSRVGEWIRVFDHFDGPDQRDRVAHALRSTLAAIGQRAALGTAEESNRWRNKQFEVRLGLRESAVDLRRAR